MRVIDTDAGVDDAVALCMALRLSDDVTAVTCCYGNCSLSHVITNVGKILVACNASQLPIYAGASRPLTALPRDAAYALRVFRRRTDCPYNGPPD